VGELDGRTFLVTGANTGIGRVTALELARRGGRVYLACRSEAKTAPVVDDIVRQTDNKEVEYLALDLADLASVRACATAFLERGEPLHVLVNNAGVGGQRGFTKDGFELNFGVNHLGHFLLTDLLLPRLKESAPARIVNVSSRSHYQARRGIDFDAVRKPTSHVTAMPEYAVSKLCNVLFTQELARRLDGSDVTSYAVHPGAVATDIWRRVPGLGSVLKLFLKSPEDGARTSLYCSTAPEVEDMSGRYWSNCRDREPSTKATPELAAELWAKSAAWCDGAA
jgi:NAD(P)-dependent dehydrogenase (short-subunit alcohol dehydrogenase family)